MTMRLAASGQVERSAALLARLRVGVNIADLRIIGTMLDPAARDATVRVLEQFRREFDAAQPSPRLLALVDEALNQLWPRRDSQKSSPVRSEERRVGKEGGSTWRYRWEPTYQKTKI